MGAQTGAKWHFAFSLFTFTPFMFVLLFSKFLSGQIKQNQAARRTTKVKFKQITEIGKHLILLYDANLVGVIMCIEIWRVNRCDSFVLMQFVNSIESN